MKIRKQYIDVDCKYNFYLIKIKYFFYLYRKPKSKYYSIPSSERNFEFINPKSTNVEIKGNMRHYKCQEERKEIKKFSNMNIHNLPNSKRTLIPSYQPINNKENINHIAFSYYSNKFNSNSVGPDFIPKEEPQIQAQRKSAAQILQESSQPQNIKQLKPNILHKKYVESSQINNIPGPTIMKRYENDKKINEDKIYNNMSSNIVNYEKNNLKRKNSYVCRNTDIESFQRKVFRDYNSNIACLPGVNINKKEKNRTLVAPNSKKYESHISFGYEENNNNKNSINKYDYNKDYIRQNKIPRPSSCSGKRIIRYKNKESNVLNNYPYFDNNSKGMNVKSYYTNEDNNKKQKYIINKNKSQIIFG